MRLCSHHWSDKLDVIEATQHFPQWNNEAVNFNWLHWLLDEGMLPSVDTDFDAANRLTKF